MENTIPSACPGTESDLAGKTSLCQGCPNQKLCASADKNVIDPDIELIKCSLSSIKHKIAVMSCKGGVGKSTVTVQLGRALARNQEMNICLLDTDITGPTLPVMMGLEGHSIHQHAEGLSPVFAEENLGVISPGFVFPGPDFAAIWRGPKKTSLIKDFLKKVVWGDLDYLVVDTPPGTSDEHFAIYNYLHNTVGFDGALLVTTPHEFAVNALRRSITFCRTKNIKIIGVVENMSDFCCPKCKAKTPIFGPSGATKEVCDELSVDFLGSIPLDQQIARLCDEGKSFYDAIETSHAAQMMNIIFNGVARYCEREKTQEQLNES